MARSITILGTVHDIQGAEKLPRKLEDPAYLEKLGELLQGKDFVFEEASENGPTKAERLAQERLGKGHYLDVDPSWEHRSAHGIGQTGHSFPVDPYIASGLTDFYRQEFETEQSKREWLWLDKIKEIDFTSALFVCGFLHTLSMGRKLREAAFTVETWTYVPYLKLCPRPHK
jgi:hypothetical protein